MKYAATVDVTDDFMENAHDPEGVVRMILAAKLAENGAELEHLDRIRREYAVDMEDHVFEWRGWTYRAWGEL